MKKVSRFVEWRGELREDQKAKGKKGWDWRGELVE
jgi:hypothetical protein